MKMEKGYLICIEVIDTILNKIEKDTSIEDIKEYLELKRIEIDVARKNIKDEASDYLDSLVKQLK